MTFEQATEQANQLNEIIVEEIDTINYKVLAIWSAQYDKEYATVLIPTKYNDQYDSADNSVQLAFLRVSIKALLSGYTTADSWVTNFDALVVEDEELNNYLNPE